MHGPKHGERDLAAMHVSSDVKWLAPERVAWPGVEDPSGAYREFGYHLTRKDAQHFLDVSDRKPMSDNYYAAKIYGTSGYTIRARKHRAANESSSEENDESPQGKRCTQTETGTSVEIPPRSLGISYKDTSYNTKDSDERSHAQIMHDIRFAEAQTWKQPPFIVMRRSRRRRRIADTCTSMLRNLSIMMSPSR